MQPLLLSVYALNEQGGREYNDDSIYPSPDLAALSDRLFMVCDGIGGSATGHVASGIICRVFADFFRQQLAPGALPDADFIRAAQTAALEAMNAYVDQHPQSAGMGSTLTLAYLHSGGAVIAWCGDSRVYHVRNGKVLFQTRDHSLVQELVRRGEISPEVADTHPQRNVILRSLTAGAQASTIDVHRITDLQAGDFLLMCTDGLLENVDEDTMNTLLQPNSGLHLGEALNNIAYGRTNDNYSMYLLEWGGKSPVNQRSSRLRSKDALKKNASKPVFVYFLTALALLAAAFWYFFLKAPASSPEPKPPAALPDTPQIQAVPADTAAQPSKFRRQEMEKARTKQTLQPQ